MGVSTSDIVYTLHDVGKRFGARELFTGVTLSFLKGARIGVIGPNGMGKSTLLKIMAGQDPDFEGTAAPAPGLSVGYVPQEPELDNTKTVGDVVDEGVGPVRALLSAYEDVSTKLGDANLDPDVMTKLLDKMTRLQEEIENKDAWEIDRHVEQAMYALQCPPREASIKDLSGGEKRRVALCRTLLSHPDLLLLDEPTNHLDAETVQWLERHLQEYQGTIVLVTHDRYFLDNVVNWMLEVDRGEARPYEGNYTTYLEARQEHWRQRSKGDDSRAKLIKRELDWIRKNPKGRTTKSKARVSRYDDLVREHRKALSSTDEFVLQIPFTQRLGDRVVTARDLSKTYGDRTLFEGLSFEIPPGAIVGIVGPNGAGKTTLVRMIVGQETTDTGTLEIGQTVDLCYLDQSREALKADNSVYDEITGGTDFIRVGEHEINGKAYVARFNFRGQAQDKKVGTLSGGERNRVQMAKMLARGGNVVILDEPTNDLDLPTLRVLEEALLEFPGCGIVVTHDRFFLDRIATHILAFEGEHGVFFHPGNFESWRDKWAEVCAERGLTAEQAQGTHRRFRS